MKRLSMFIIAMAGLLATATSAKSEQIRAVLTGYEETPSAVSTTGRGEFSAIIADDGQSIRYRETFSRLQGKITQSHIHVGQLSIGGSVVIFLCQTDTNKDPTGLAPQCPQEGTVTGVITSANVIAGSQTPQQLAAGDLAAIITAIHAGATYANVHTDLSPGGEIRGQIRVVGK
jgi:CHRD domain